MLSVAKLNINDRRVLFTNTGEKMGLHPSIIEKDFWVCYLLNILFHEEQWKRAFVFKGGTSLSKAYHAIERFSEDIDIVLDWRLIDYTTNDAWKDRSRTNLTKEWCVRHRHILKIHSRWI